MKSDSSDARNATAAATSSGNASLPQGTVANSPLITCRVAEQGASHVRLDVARADRINVDLVLCKLQRRGAGEHS